MYYSLGIKYAEEDFENFTGVETQLSNSFHLIVYVAFWFARPCNGKMPKIKDEKETLRSKKKSLTWESFNSCTQGCYWETRDFLQSLF